MFKKIAAFCLSLTFLMPYSLVNATLTDTEAFEPERPDIDISEIFDIPAELPAETLPEIDLNITSDTFSMEEMIALYENGYSPLDMQIAQELAKEAKVKPFELLKAKGKSKIVGDVEPDEEDADVKNGKRSNRGKKERKVKHKNIEENSWKNVKKRFGIKETELVPNASDADDEIELLSPLAQAILDGGWDDSANELESNNAGATHEALTETPGISNDAENTEEYVPIITDLTNDDVNAEKETGMLDLISSVFQEKALAADNLPDTTIGLFNDYIIPSETYKYSTKPYTSKSDVSIDPITENLTVTETDISLPGKNGLDLNLTRTRLSRGRFLGIKKQLPTFGG